VLYAGGTLVPVFGPELARVANVFGHWTNIPAPGDPMTNEEALGVALEAGVQGSKLLFKTSARFIGDLWRTEESAARAERSVSIGLPAAAAVYSLWNHLDESSKDEMIFQMFTALNQEAGTPIEGIRYTGGGNAYLDLRPRNWPELKPGVVDNALRKALDSLDRFNLVFRHTLPDLLRSYDSVVGARKSFQTLDSGALHSDTSPSATERRFQAFLAHKIQLLNAAYHRGGHERELDVMLDVMRRMWPQVYPELLSSLVTR